MKFGQDLCLNFWYELNPRVRCAFGNVSCIIVHSYTRKKDLSNLHAKFKSVLEPCSKIRHFVQVCQRGSGFFLMCTQFLVIPPITQVEILWYAGAKSTDRKDQRPWSNASKVCSSTSILWTHSNVFSHRISIHRICVCLWICKSTCAKVDVRSASFARQSVRMRSNSRGAVAHTSKIGAIFPPCQEILVQKLR